MTELTDLSGRLPSMNCSGFIIGAQVARANPRFGRSISLSCLTTKLP